MHLAYADEAGIGDKEPILVYGAVIVPEHQFHWAERYAGIAVEQMFTPETVDTFKEFKGRQLFEGEGPFKDVSEEARFSAIEILLRPQVSQKDGFRRLPFIYCAIDKARKERTSLANAPALDLAFHNCLLGVDGWALKLPSRQRELTWAFEKDARVVEPEHFVLVIVDEPGGERVNQVSSLKVEDERRELQEHRKAQERKDVYRRTYRRLRQKFLPSSSSFKDTKVWQLHDSMYFGDSRDSVGLQMADLRCYFMTRVLRGDRDPDVLRFYEMFKADCICAKFETNRMGDFLLSHEEII